MKTFLLFLLATILLHQVSWSRANDSLESSYKNNTIYRSGTRFQKGAAKLTYHILPNAFIAPETKCLYFKSKQLQTTATVFNIASVRLALFFTFSSAKQTVTTPVAVSSGILGLISPILHPHSSKLLDKAIWITNGQTLFKQNHH